MDAPLNTSGARVIDPILSNHARGYAFPGLAYPILFPVVFVPVRGFKVIRFGRESFRLYNSRRAPGAATKRIQVGHQSDPARLHQHRLEGQVPVEHLEEAAAVPGIDLGARAVNVPMRAIGLAVEVEAAALARDPDNYAATHKAALAGNDKWSDPDSDPEAAVDDAKETVRGRIGTEPNAMVVGPRVFKALKRHPKIKEHFRYGGDGAGKTVNAAMLADFFDLDAVVTAKSIYADDDDAFQNVWGDDAILAYVPPADEARDYAVPSFGYTYRLNGHPAVSSPYFEENAISWIYPVADELSAELTGMDAGFLFQNAI